MAVSGPQVKVSVVVPVFNPGPFILPLIESLLAQTMPATEFEAIFVDDGSDDETPALLERLAREHDHVHLLHIPRSGWAGRPRNVGVDHAVGQYVQFVDHDDWLGVEALERLYRYAVENGSDVVVGKEVRGAQAWTSYALFDENRPRAVLGKDPLLRPLTPHKMFRREFLIRHGIRFPEGRRRLADHPFVVRAYFQADVISVLSDYPVYHWHRREDGGNASALPRDWVEWYGYVEEVLDVVEEFTEPGRLRDRLLSQWYVGKVLQMLSKKMPSMDEAESRTFFEAAADITVRRFPPHLDRFAKGFAGAHAHLLRQGDHSGLLAFVRWENGLALRGDVEAQRRDGDRDLVEIRATLEDGARGPVRLRSSEGQWLLDAPSPVPTVPAASLDVTPLISGSAIQLMAVHVDTGEVRKLSGSATIDGAQDHGAAEFTVRGAFDLAPAGRPLAPGSHRLALRARVRGTKLRASLGAIPGLEVRPPLRRGARGRLFLDVLERIPPHDA